MVQFGKKRRIGRNFSFFEPHTHRYNNVWWSRGKKLKCLVLETKWRTQLLNSLQSQVGLSNNRFYSYFDEFFKFLFILSSLFSIGNFVYWFYGSVVNKPNNSRLLVQIFFFHSGYSYSINFYSFHFFLSGIYDISQIQKRLVPTPACTYELLKY